MVVVEDFGQKALRVSSARRECCAMALVPIFPGAALLRVLHEPGSGWESAALAGTLCQRLECFGANEQSVPSSAGRLTVCKLQPSDRTRACFWCGEC